MDSTLITLFGDQANFHREAIHGNGLVLGEILLSPHQGETSVEHIFAAVAAQGLEAEADLWLVPQAIRFAQTQPGISTINIAPETLLSSDFSDMLAHLEATMEGYDPHKVIFEVTERSTFPEGANMRPMHNLLKKGYGLLIDDLDPLNEENASRGHTIDGHAVGIKLDYTIAAMIRNGGTLKNTAMKAITTYKKQHPGGIVIAEGVRHGETELIRTIQTIGVTAIQYYEGPKV